MGPDIGHPAGNDAHYNAATLDPHDAIDDLIEGAVSSVTDHEIIARFGRSPGQPDRVPAKFLEGGVGLPPGRREHRDDVGEPGDILADRGLMMRRAVLRFMIQAILSIPRVSLAAARTPLALSPSRHHSAVPSAADRPGDLAAGHRRSGARAAARPSPGSTPKRSPSSMKPCPIAGSIASRCGLERHPCPRAKRRPVTLA